MRQFAPEGSALAARASALACTEARNTFPGLPHSSATPRAASRAASSS